MNYLIRNKLLNSFNVKYFIRFNSTNNQIKSEDNDSSKQLSTITHHLNNQIKDYRSSRLFAILMVGGSQYKVTTEDVIVVRNHFYPTIGDKIRLEKVLLVGGKDFTIVGKPLVEKKLVRVEATVIEKTLANDVIIFRYKPRKDNRKMDFYKGILTLLRINSIEIEDNLPDV